MPILPPSVVRRHTCFSVGLTKAGNLIMDPIKEAYDANVQNIFKGKAKMLISQMDDAQAAVVGVRHWLGKFSIN